MTLRGDQGREMIKLANSIPILLIFTFKLSKAGSLLCI